MRSNLTLNGITIPAIQGLFLKEKTMVKGGKVGTFWKEGYDMALRNRKVNQLEGDLFHWQSRRRECADQGTISECDVQIDHIKNDLQRLQS